MFWRSPLVSRFNNHKIHILNSNKSAPLFLPSMFMKSCIQRNVSSYISRFVELDIHFTKSLDKGSYRNIHNPYLIAQKRDSLLKFRIVNPIYKANLNSFSSFTFHNGGIYPHIMNRNTSKSKIFESINTKSKIKASLSPIIISSERIRFFCQRPPSRLKEEKKELKQDENHSEQKSTSIHSENISSSNSNTISSNPSTTSTPNVISNIGEQFKNSTKEYEKIAYEIEKIEKKVMEAVHTKDRKRFRITFISVSLLLIWIISTFGKDIRQLFSKQTAQVAKETLADESLQIQTQQLSAAVVQYILNDPEILALTQSFLRQASSDPETQTALLNLVRNVLLHEETVDATVELGHALVKRVLQSKEALDQVSVLMVQVLQDNRVKKGAIALLLELCQDDDVLLAFVELTTRLFAEKEVQTRVNQLMGTAVNDVLNDQTIQLKSKEFVSDVVSDDSVQRTGVDAIWSQLSYSVSSRLSALFLFSILTGVLFFIKSN